jgi:hypothetical protein
MSIQGVESTVGPNGKAILEEMRSIERQYPDLIALRDTDLGLHVLFTGSDMEVELVQMWGATGMENAHSLESRVQFITKRIYLDNGERNRISFLLQHARFKPCCGFHGNFRLEFDESKATVRFDKAYLTNLREAVVEMAKIAKAARNRSWK